MRKFIYGFYKKKSGRIPRFKRTIIAISRLYADEQAMEIAVKTNTFYLLEEECKNDNNS